MDVKTLTMTDAAYVAGLIDGDGSIRRGGNGRTGGPRLALTIRSGERHLLEHVRQTVGAGQVLAPGGAAGGAAYALHDDQALALLAQVQPHLRTHKAGRATLILREYLDRAGAQGKGARRASAGPPDGTLTPG